MVNLEIYKDCILPQIPRLLGLGDRQPDSTTYGCFDRYFWHYKILDFTNARFQEVSTLLAHLYSYQFEGNSYYQNPKIKEWALAAVKYWIQSRHGDGSVDEVYPFEHSFCATSFGLYAATKTMLMLEHTDEHYLNALQKSACWLSTHENMLVANQMAGACAALQQMFLLTQEHKYKKAAEQKFERLLTLQQPEGYFLEYGGYDMGYLTYGISFLAKYVEDSGCSEAKLSLMKAIEFADSKLFEDGTYNYEETSRKTQYFYPYAYLHQENLHAIQKHTHAVTNNQVLQPGWMDDRFLTPLGTDFLITFIEGTKRYANDHKPVNAASTLQ